MAELVIEDIVVRYGAADALRGVSLRVGSGQVVTVAGPNGAGKSTLLKAVIGLVTPVRGRIAVDSRNIVGMQPSTLFRDGVALVPEWRGVFATLTVDENLRLAAAAFKGRHDDELAHCLELFPRLAERRHVRAELLSGGEQQQLTISRALIARPRFLLLDEPSTGLAPILVREVLDVVRALAATGVGILLVEQFVQEAASISNEVHVLARGELRAQLTSEEAVAALADGTFFTAYSGRDDRTEPVSARGGTRD